MTPFPPDHSLRSPLSGCYARYAEQSPKSKSGFWGRRMCWNDRSKTLGTLATRGSGCGDTQLQLFGHFRFLQIIYPGISQGLKELVVLQDVLQGSDSLRVRQQLIADIARRISNIFPGQRGVPVVLSKEGHQSVRSPDSDRMQDRVRLGTVENLRQAHLV